MSSWLEQGRLDSEELLPALILGLEPGLSPRQHNGCNAADEEEHKCREDDEVLPAHVAEVSDDVFHVFSRRRLFLVLTRSHRSLSKLQRTLNVIS